MEVKLPGIYKSTMNMLKRRQKVNFNQTKENSKPKLTTTKIRAP